MAKQVKALDLHSGDIVGYTDPFMRAHFGDMEIVNILPNNRVDVTSTNPEKASIWAEYTIGLKLITRKNSPC